MAGITPIGISIALAVLAIGMLALVARRWRGKPKLRAERWEKAEIMKQLLALSDGESSLAVKERSVRGRAPTSRRARRTDTLVKTPRKAAALPIRSKTS